MSSPVEPAVSCFVQPELLNGVIVMIAAVMVAVIPKLKNVLTSHYKSVHVGFT